MQRRPTTGILQKETGLLSNQGEKSINFYFIRVPLRKKVLKYGTPKPRKMVKAAGFVALGLRASLHVVGVAANFE